MEAAKNLIFICILDNYISKYTKSYCILKYTSIKAQSESNAKIRKISRKQIIGINILQNIKI